MKVLFMPPILEPFVQDWLIWRPEECDGQHYIFPCKWGATRRRPLTAEDRAAGLDATLLRGSADELEAALAEQARREKARLP